MINSLAVIGRNILDGYQAAPVISWLLHETVDTFTVLPRQNIFSLLNGTLNAAPAADEAQVNAALQGLNKAMTALVRELDSPVTEVRPDFTTVLKFPYSFPFKFPHRENHKLKWLLKDFAMLSGTSVTIRVTYKKEGDLIIRSINLVFKGTDEMHNGFWGPVEGEFDESKPFPHTRIDRIVFIEAYDKNGAPAPHYTVETYDSTPKKEEITFRVDLDITLRDKKNGERENCDIEGSVLKGRGIKVSCSKKNVLEFKYEKQMNDIFKNMKSLGIYADSAGGLIEQAYNDWSKRLKIPVESKTKSMDMAVMLWFLWHVGMRSTFDGSNMMDVIKVIENNLPTN